MNKSITAALIGITIIALALGFNFVKVNEAFKQIAAQNVVLEQTNTQSKKEIAALSNDLKEKQRALVKLNDQLRDLRYPVQLKNSLAAAQETIATLNAELQDLRTKSVRLERENYSMKTRVKSSSQEISRLLKELDTAKKALGGAGKEVDASGRDAKLEALTKELSAKGTELNALEQEIDTIKEQYRLVLIERDQARKELVSAQKMYAKKDTASDKRLRRDLKELRATLLQKERRIKELEVEVSKAGRVDTNIERELTRAREKQQEFATLNSNLQEKIIQLTGLIDEKEKRLALLEEELKRPRETANEDMDALRGKIFIQKDRLERITTLYEHLKVQLKDVAAILSKREEALLYKERELDLVRDEVSYLKTKLANMQIALKHSQDNQKLVAQRISEVTSLNTKLHDQLSETSDFIQNQDEVESSLHDRISLEASLLGETGKKEAAAFRSETSQGEKAKAEELRKKVEVILQPF